MNDYNEFRERFKNRRDEFERDFERTRRMAKYWTILALAVTGGVGAFIIWVIIKFMQFYGVV